MTWPPVSAAGLNDAGHVYVAACGTGGRSYGGAIRVERGEYGGAVEEDTRFEGDLREERGQ